MLDYLESHFEIVPTPIAEIKELVLSGIGTGS